MRHFEVLKDLLRQGQGEHPGEEEEADDFLQVRSLRIEK